MRYIGVDLHSNNFTICFLAEDGTHTFEKYQLKELEAFKSTLRPMITLQSKRPATHASFIPKSLLWWPSASLLTPASSA